MRISDPKHLVVAVEIRHQADCTPLKSPFVAMVIPINLPGGDYKSKAFPGSTAIFHAYILVSVTAHSPDTHSYGAMKV